MDQEWNLGESLGCSKKKDEDSESHILDSTITKVHQHASGGAGGKAVNGIGKTRGGWGTKIHAVVDGLGYPIDIRITEGQRNDCTQAIELLKNKSSENVVADTAYDSDEIRKLLIETGRNAVIPNNPCRSQKHYFDKHIYKERHLVENFFQKIKNLRRIATRYEKTLQMFQGMVLIACILVYVMF
jgi:transposase